LKGEIYNKSYYKKAKTPFYINGEAYINKDGKQINKIFKEISLKTFNDNLETCRVPK
jgi:hypothetical protein